MHLLCGAVRNYAWGSRTVIADFMGNPSPTAHPEAELWLGAHPGDPAYLQTPLGRTSLLDAIAADPDAQLGPEVQERFGSALPFLAKVLAADEPLSLQAHPSSVQAAQGFDLEERQGLPIGAPNRNYRDRSHKPELIVALGPFDALAGFRSVPRSVEFMRALGVSALDPYINLLTGQSDADGLRAVFTTWITLPQPDLDVLVPAVLDGAVNYIRSGDTEFADESRTVLELGEQYPGDAGVLAAMLLNRIRLEAGEGIYLPAGILHAYLCGIGFEVMANSDNVLRGGLTPKHVDVPELLRVLDFTPTDGVPIRPRAVGDGLEWVYDTPAPEFAVSSIRVDGDRLGQLLAAPACHDGPQILLCTEGVVDVHTADASLTLSRGAAAWVAACDGLIRVAAEHPAELFRTTVGI